LLFVVCYLLFVVCCLLFVICYYSPGLTVSDYLEKENLGVDMFQHILPSCLSFSWGLE
jgi:hypothetical protein